LGTGGEHDHGKYQNCTGGTQHYHTWNLLVPFQLYFYLRRHSIRWSINFDRFSYGTLLDM
jgi:hypothetical protein